MKQWLAEFLKDEDRASRIIASWMVSVLLVCFVLEMIAISYIK